MYCKEVIYNDIDPNKLEYCKKNAQTYNCDDNIKFINSDYLEIDEKLKVKNKIKLNIYI
jgi:methylase of polypeptide subunit release factors